VYSVYDCLLSHYFDWMNIKELWKYKTTDIVRALAMTIMLPSGMVRKGDPIVTLGDGELEYPG